MANRSDTAENTREMRHKLRVAERLAAISRIAEERAEDLRARVALEFGPMHRTVKRLAREAFELGPDHTVTRVRWRMFANALDPDRRRMPVGLDEALIIFTGGWRLNIGEAENQELSLFNRRDAALRASRYRAAVICLRWLRRARINARTFEMIRRRLIA